SDPVRLHDLDPALVAGLEAQDPLLRAILRDPERGLGEIERPPAGFHDDRVGRGTAWNEIHGDVSNLVLVAGKVTVRHRGAVARYSCLEVLRLELADLAGSRRNLGLGERRPRKRDRRSAARWRRGRRAAA